MVQLPLWRWYANAVGVALLCGIIAYAIMWTFTTKGPVIEVIAGPDPSAVVTVPMGGSFAYDLETLRHESCPGTVVASFTRKSPGKMTETIIVPRPVLSTEIKPASQSRVHWALPEAIFPDHWVFNVTVESQCPLRHQIDTIAQFPLNVVRESKNVE